MLKRLLASFLLIIFLANTVFVPAAQAQWYNQDPVRWYNQVYGDETPPTEIFGERYVAAQVDWIILSFLTWLPTKTLGTKTTSCLWGITWHQDVELVQCVEGFSEVIQDVIDIKEKILDNSQQQKSFFTAVFNPDRQLSGVNYLKSKYKNLSLVKTAEAQVSGFGYGTLEGITLDFWKVSRNVSYGFFILLTIILAFMIMFRVKTSPQTAITVQSAIPKVIITLALITFSYAIAGFMIDLMYVVIGIISFIFDPIVRNPQDMFTLLTTGFKGTGVFGFLVFDLFAYPFAFLTASVALAGGGNIFATQLLAIIGAVITIIMFLLLILILGFIHLKITYLLLKTTALILISVMFAPIQIAFGLVSPQIGFGSWLKNLAANLAVFPTIGVFLVLSWFFLSESLNISLADISTIPQIREVFGFTRSYGANFGNGWPPLLAGTGDPAALIMFGISFVLLSLAPKATDVIKGVISGRPFAYGTAFGEGLAPAVVPIIWGKQQVTRGAGSALSAGITGAVGAKMINYSGKGSGYAKTVGGWLKPPTHAPGTSGRS